MPAASRMEMPAGFATQAVGLDHEMGGVRAIAADAEIAGGAEHLAADQVGRPLHDTPAKSRPGVRGKTA